MIPRGLLAHLANCVDAYVQAYEPYSASELYEALIPTG